MAGNTVLSDKDPKLVSRTALKVFFNITRAWGLDPQDEQVLLGNPDRITFEKWRNGEGPIVSQATLVRISYVLGIYKALRLLFPTEERACAWPHKPNAHFEGASALSVMLREGAGGLSEVRGYLDGIEASNP